MCMPTAVVTVMGWPTLDPWVPPSIDFVYNTHVCVVTAAVGLPKLLNFQNLHLTSSLGCCATHVRCSQQQVVGQPSVDLFCNTGVYVLTAAIGLPNL